MAAELQTCDPAAVPRTRAGVQAYFEQMRPQLIGSDIARQAMNHLLRAEVMLPPMPRPLRPATLVSPDPAPRHAGDHAPLDARDGRAVRVPALGAPLDAAVTLPLRTAFRVISLDTRLQLMVLRLLSPNTVEVAARVLRAIPPVDPVTTTPREAQARYGYDVPRQAHRQLRDRQRNRVFGEGRPPSDEGIIESQPILGTVG